MKLLITAAGLLALTLTSAIAQQATPPAEVLVASEPVQPLPVKKKKKKTAVTKPASKPAPEVAAKPALKSDAKTAATPETKPAAPKTPAPKVVAKTAVAKPTDKSAQKVAAKPVEKPVPKVATKEAPKVAAKAAPKPTVKTAVAKPSEKPAPKIAGKAAPKVVAKTAPKPANKVAIAKPAEKPAPVVAAKPPKATAATNIAGLPAGAKLLTKAEIVSAYGGKTLTWSHPYTNKMKGTVTFNQALSAGTGTWSDDKNKGEWEGKMAMKGDQYCFQTRAKGDGNYGPQVCNAVYLAGSTFYELDPKTKKILSVNKIVK